MSEEKHNHLEGEECEIEEAVITLIDEDNIEHDFYFVDMVELGEDKYAILAPCEEEEEDDEEGDLIAMKIVEEDGQEMLYSIEDDDEYERVKVAWDKMVDEEASVLKTSVYGQRFFLGIIVQASA